MFVQPRNLAGPSQLAAAAASVYTVPAGQTIVITSVIALNTNASATRRVSAHIGRLGVAASASNMILDGVPISVDSTGFGETLVLSQLRSIVLNGTDILYMFADAANEVNVVVSGYATQ